MAVAAEASFEAIGAEATKAAATVVRTAIDNFIVRLVVSKLIVICFDDKKEFDNGLKLVHFDGYL